MKLFAAENHLMMESHTMQFVIETVTTPAQEALAESVRRQVFESEFRMKAPELEPADEPGTLDLLATARPRGEPVASLTVVDTSGHDELHAKYGLPFPRGTRAARYTRLAVLKPYRGLSLPLALVCEANHRFVSTGRFDYTWLLFEPQRAESSVFCTLLGFTPHAQIFVRGYGLRTVLIRNEYSSRPVPLDNVSQLMPHENLMYPVPVLNSIASPYSQSAAV